MKLTKLIVVDEDGTIPLIAFKDLLNVKKIVYYKIEPLKDHSLKITFFDKKMVEPVNL